MQKKNMSWVLSDLSVLECIIYWCGLERGKGKERASERERESRIDRETKSDKQTEKERERGR